MNKACTPGALFAGVFALLASATQATPVSFNLDFVFTGVSGNYTTAFATGDSVIGSFVYDTDEANASASDTNPGTVPGHQYSSRYTFTGAAYGADFSIPARGVGFTDTGDIEVLVNNDLFLTSAETGGLLADGTYDWIEVLATTAVDVCPSGQTCPPDSFTPGNGEEWTLAIFGPSDWFTDGSVIPDTLPGSYQTLLVGFTFDSNGDEVAAAFASASPVPLPAAIWLFGGGLLGLIGMTRKKRTA